jgi:hypothetical protein
LSSNSSPDNSRALNSAVTTASLKTSLYFGQIEKALI